MKKTLILFIAALLLAACSESDVLQVIDKEQKESTELSQIRTIDEAYEIASKSISWIDEPFSRSVVRLLPPKNEVKVVKDINSRRESIDTLMYVINFEDEQGFAIIPANRNMPDLLAITESGSYDPEVGSEIEPFNDYMDNIMNSLYRMPLPVDTLREPFKETRIETTTTISKKIAPTINYTWGQRGVNGKYCSNGYCGCANLAAVMIFAHFGYPTSIQLHHQNDSVINLNWAEIRQHNSRHYFDLSTGYCINDIEYQSQDALGLLCREMGYRSNSSYHGLDENGHALGTSTAPVDIRAAIVGSGFSASAIKDYKAEDEYSPLSDGSILFVIGYDYNIPENVAGHGWILDGHKTITLKTCEYVRDADPNLIAPGDWELVHEASSVNSYSHFNWGWNGACNGWFYQNMWKTDAGYEYDNDWRTQENYNFSSIRYYFSVKL